MFQSLREGLYSRLADIIGGVPRRGGNALLRPGVDDGGGSALGDHRPCERLDPIDHAPKVDPEHANPGAAVLDRGSAAADSGIVHQNTNLAETLERAALQHDHLLKIGDIGQNGLDGGALPGGRPRFLRTLVKALLISVGHEHVETETGEPDRRRPANPIGRSSDNGGAAAFKPCDGGQAAISIGGR